MFILALIVDSLSYFLLIMNVFIVYIFNPSRVRWTHIRGVKLYPYIFFLFTRLKLVTLFKKNQTHCHSEQQALVSLLCVCIIGAIIGVLS